MLIQILDWYTYDAKNKDGEYFKMLMFGKNEENKSVTLHIDDFPPHFFIKVPKTWESREKKILIDWIIKNIHYKSKNSIIRSKCICMSKKEFYGFDNFNSYNFVRIMFKSYNGLRSCRRLFEESKEIDDERYTFPKKITIPNLLYNKILPIYEANIDPILRLIHFRDLKACGWLSIKDKYLLDVDVKSTSSELEFSLENGSKKYSWQNLNPHKLDTSSKIKIMCLDIECDSSHGDFPLAKKDCLSLSRQIVEWFIDSNKIITKSVIIKYLTTVLIDKKNIQIPELAFLDCVEIPDEDKIEKISDDILKIFSPKNINKNGNIFTGYRVRDEDNTINYILSNKTEMKHNKNLLITQSQKKIVLSSIFNDVLKKKFRKCKVIELNDLLNGHITKVYGDPVIQIVSSFIYFGESTPYKTYAQALNSCDQLENTETISYDTEEDLLLDFHRILKDENPDLYTGYNIYNFDIPFLYERAEELDIIDEFSVLGRINGLKSELKVKGGKLNCKFVNMPGRISLDIYNIVKRDYNLSSYKLDSVSANFIRGKISKYDKNKLYTNNTKSIKKGDFIKVLMNLGYSEDVYKDKKYEIIDIDYEKGIIMINDVIGDDIVEGSELYWCLGKDDISPKDIFTFQKQGPYERYLILKYCAKDVWLCIELLNLLQIISKNIAMANVCSTPISWILERGQSIKILSLVAKTCREKGFLIPTINKSPDLSGYEGACVLRPYPDIYLEHPIAVLDYASLYPSSMIAKNLSHECYCIDKQWLGVEGGEKINKLGYTYSDIKYDNFKIINKKKVIDGKKTVRFVQLNDGKKGIIPEILNNLLTARKNTRNKMKFKTIKYKDENGLEQVFEGIPSNLDDTRICMKNINNKVIIDKSKIISTENTYKLVQQDNLEGQQLAYKVTANSLYGQLGARTSPIYLKEIAAATTAEGRTQLEKASEFAENPMNFPQVLNTGETIYLKNKTVYGDTDSVFIKFDVRDGDGNPITGKAALQPSIDLAISIERRIVLDKPQYLEYEKTFYPYLQIAKKKYVGNLYEHDVNKFKRKAMGIVLKRRDNATILKIIYGGIIDIIMDDKDISKAADYCRRQMRNIINGKFDMNKFIISKSLNGYYKDPDRIAHKVLADRIGDRDPGNKPETGDRIPYIYIKNDKAILQGDRIESPSYIIENKIPIDYDFYITNQLMNPISQIFSLVVEKLGGYKEHPDYFKQLRKSYKTKYKTEEEIDKKIKNEREKMASTLMFGDIQRVMNHRTNNTRDISSYFSRPVKSNATEKSK